VLTDGITINALPMLHLDTNGSVLNPGHDTYYSQRVVGGPARSWCRRWAPTHFLTPF
jgi:hypothetical protein